MHGFRLITTTYTYFADLDEAKQEALRRRGEGKRTEIITEQHYNENYSQYHKPMQDHTHV